MHTGKDRPIRVLAVDDSAVMRGVLRKLFQRQEQKHFGDFPAMQLCGLAEDGVECLSAVLDLHPDVVVLDLEMPRMHGLDVLERLRLDEPSLPVIMCSSYTECGARSTLDALALGAADYVMKPAGQNDFDEALESLASQLLPKIAALAASGFEINAAQDRLSPQHSTKSEQCANTGSVRSSTTTARVEIVVIGVSTGGPSALEVVLPKLAKDFPVPILIVQHMPKLFTGELAERLDRCCALHVREAIDGAEVKPGTIWLAPGDAHMEIATESQRLIIRLHQQRALNNCKPSVDYLFTSAASLYGAGTLALIMTGMGADGLVGARRVHEAGGIVLTQDAATSAVWGMPGRVFEAGLSREPRPLSALANELTLRVQAGRGGCSPFDVPAMTTMMQLRSKHSAIAARPEVIHGLH